MSYRTGATPPASMPHLRRAMRVVASLVAIAALGACQTIRPQAPTQMPPAAHAVAPLSPPQEASPQALSTHSEIVSEPAPAAATLARLRQQLQAPLCPDRPDSMLWLTYYASPRARLGERLSQVLPLLDFVERHLATIGLPAEFALIPLIESDYRADAKGAGGAAGLWQMLAATARAHGAVIDSSGDARFSVLESTLAATSYLQMLQKRFGDWRIAAMAYNAGEARIARLLSSSTAGVPTNLDQSRLPKVTRAYIARLDALRCVIAEPQRYALVLPEFGPADPLVVIAIPPTAYSLHAIATALGLDDDRLQQLNGGLKQPYFPPRDTRRVLAPQPTPEALATLALVREEAPAVATHVVRVGESLWSIARRYQLRVTELRQFNQLKPDAILHPGQALRLRP